MSEPLTPDEFRRYSRQIVLPELGELGQARLKSASALIVGLGGLGSPAALYLAAAGIGRIGLVDFDRVEESNLHRQILYGVADVGRPKIEVAAERLRAANPLIAIEPHGDRFARANARSLVAAYDLVLDGTDNFPTRYLVNDACVLERKPNVYASIFRFEGQVSIFGLADGPCYRCLFPEPPPPGLVPSCAEGGVLGVLPGIVGALQASEAIRFLLGVGRPLAGRLLVVDALAARFREVAVPKNPECPICSANPTQTDLVETEEVCAPGTIGRANAAPRDLAPGEVKALLARGDAVELLDVRLPVELAIARLDGARWIPLHELPERLAELPRDRAIVAYCHVGARSAQAAEYLRDRGFPNAFNLAGGIDAWSREIDPSVPRY